ncbi:hypothetical protein EJ06DRAFT_161073 [Trichodelitschia bisporula]|uniref:Uncharacterized protein n=1 Tax=Trichodelitschia bisporula TaxID=703511 RepID=A0A6G1HM12_9PEZI|nr:hypothetical protein EJ06DRAFT_161073 [Trichodelitschia bisporula]
MELRGRRFPPPSPGLWAAACVFNIAIRCQLRVLRPFCTARTSVIRLAVSLVCISLFADDDVYASASATHPRRTLHFGLARGEPPGAGAGIGTWSGARHGAGRLRRILIISGIIMGCGSGPRLFVWGRED